MALLNVSHLTKRYDKFELSDVSFSIEENQIVGFVGENGAGKTTTVKLIGGLALKDGGHALYRGKEVDDLSPKEREEIAITFDEPVFPDKMKVEGLEKILKGLFPSWDREKFFRSLSDFRIDKGKRMNELSKGMRAKLNLAIAFSHEAKLLLLDEPANGLDPVARDDLLGLLKNFAKLPGHAIVISSHIVSDLEKIADGFIFLQRGKVLAFKTKVEILESFALLERGEDDPSGIPQGAIVAKRKDPLTGKVEFLLQKDRLQGCSLPCEPITVEKYSLLLMQNVAGSLRSA